MAVKFTNAGSPLGTSYKTIYTCPDATCALILTAHVASIGGSSACISGQWVDVSNASLITRLADTIAVPGFTALNILSGKHVLTASDYFQAKASASVSGSSILEVSLAIMEMT